MMVVERRTARTTTIMMMLTVMLTICWISVEGLQNLIRNPSFEEPLKGTWTGSGFSMTQHTGDQVDGRVSLLCSQRKKALAGPSQVLPPLKPGRGYELRANVRLLNGHPDKLFQSFKAIMVFKFNQTAKDTLTIGASKGKAPSCKGKKGQERKECLAERRRWKADMKQRKAEKKRRKDEKKKLKEERKKKKMAEKKKKEQDKAKKKKQKQKDKKDKEKERERAQRDEAKEKGKERKEDGENSSPPLNNTDENTKPDLPVSRQPRDVKDHVTFAAGTSSGDSAIPLSRKRRQQRRRRVDPPTTILQRGKSLAPTDDQHDVKPASGYNTREGVYIIAWRAWVTPEQGWMTLVGSINAPVISFSRSTLRIRGPDENCDFLMDNVTLYEIPEHVDWMAESQNRINKYRKTDVLFRVNIPRSVPRADIDIQVRLKKHLFAFGSKVEDDLMRHRDSQKFQDLFFTLFNWATLGSFKWRFDKGPTLFLPDFGNAQGALEVLRQHGLKVRAHSILWGVKKNIPEEVIATPPDQLPALISFHTQYMINITRGKVAHWDVQNELLHGHWYEETLKDPNITIKVFKEARRLDPTPKLYLNDFTAVTSGANTEDLHDTAIRFNKAGAGIQGLGIQGHVKDLIRPDPTMMWRRLDRLAETGLELFMTEFDLGWNDDAVRADWFEDAMRAFFAHPGLHGVILWGIWKDRQRYKNKFLVYGEDLKFSEQGERFVCLVKKEWTTNETFNMAYRSGFRLRAFQGDYEVLVRRRGVPVQRTTFSLGKTSQTIDVAVTESTAPIQVEEERDYVPECISHRDRKSLGVLYTTASDPRLTCVDRTAAVASAFSSRSQASVKCPEGSVMIGCSSYHQTRMSRFWLGEEIRLEGGVATCTASIHPYDRAGVQVSARCCQQAELTCDYRQAGPSSPMTGAMAEAKCPIGYTTVGCSVFSQYSHINGVFPANNLTSCRAVNGHSSSYSPTARSGVVSGAVCCKSRRLRCHTVMSEASQAGQEEVMVTCPRNEVMTGCNVQAANGGTAGSYLSRSAIGTGICAAHVAADNRGRRGSVMAVAICCT